MSLAVLLAVLTALDATELRAGALGDPFQELPDDVLVLGPAVVGGRAEDRLGSLCRLEEGEPLDPLLMFLAGAVFCPVLLGASTQEKCKEAQE